VKSCTKGKLLSDEGTEKSKIADTDGDEDINCLQLILEWEFVVFVERFKFHYIKVIFNVKNLMQDIPMCY
jgi:hypothetical protein